jgi:hypothetical protein
MSSTEHIGGNFGFVNGNNLRGNRACELRQSAKLPCG